MLQQLQRLTQRHPTKIRAENGVVLRTARCAAVAPPPLPRTRGLILAMVAPPPVASPGQTLRAVDRPVACRPWTPAPGVPPGTLTGSTRTPRAGPPAMPWPGHDASCRSPLPEAI